MHSYLWRRSVNRFAGSSCVLALLVVMLHGCSALSVPPQAGPLAVLRLATTTSTRDSGLLDVLLPPFERANGCRVDVVAVGTGAALRLGEAGDADVLIVHARDAEDAFMAARHGTRHEEFMYNNFVLLGPKLDPAHVAGLDPVEALATIAKGQYTFLSRGDDSGTHRRELAIWKMRGTRPDWPNYLEVGQGMGTTLMMADEKQAYVLSDMGTYLNFKGKIELVPLAAMTDALRNPYSVITVNGDKNLLIKAELANQFVEYLVSEPTQKAIADYQVARQQLFYPTRLAKQRAVGSESTGG